MWVFTIVILIYGCIISNYDIVMFACFWLAPLVSFMDYSYRLTWEIERKREHDREQRRIERDKRLRRSTNNG